MNTNQDMNNDLPSVATIGFFDGVHRGHQYLIEQLKQIAKERRLQTTVITFGQHPRQALQSDYQPMLLSTLAEKQLLLKKNGVENCFVLPFNKQMASLSARDFMQKVLVGVLNVKVLVIGYDNRFGHNREEGFDDYVRYGNEIGVEVVRATPYTDADIRVSSSVTRTFLSEGNVGYAARCLGRPYVLTGTVIHGFSEGRKMGFPTANLQCDEGKMVPADGAYAVRVKIGSEFHRGMLNIGVRPTLNNGEEHSIEVHIIDYDNDLYGQTISVEFIERLRSEKKFGSKDELMAQLALDVEQVKRIIR